MISIVIELEDSALDYTNHQIEHRLGTAIGNMLPDAVILHLEVSDGDLKKAFGIEIPR